MFQIDATVQSQYAASPHLRKLVDSFWEALDPGADIESIYNNMVNLDTAVGFGLDVWGRIVAIGRDYASTDVTTPYWGYKPPAGVINDRVRNFGNAPFYKPVNGTVRLTDTAYRTYILIKAMINIGDATLASLNRMLKVMFPDVTMSIVHTDTMVLRLVVQTPISQADLDALLTLQWLPAGVGLELYQVITPTWGLEGSGLETLDNGTFAMTDLTE